MGAIKSDSKDDCIYLTEVSIAVGNLLVKLWVLIWKQKQFLEMLGRICVFSVECHDDFVHANEKLKRFINVLMAILVVLLIGDISGLLITPYIGSEKTLLFNVAFPFDWKNNDIAFLLANAYIVYGVGLGLMAFLFSTTIWYVMLNLSLRYELLGNQLTNMGTISNESTRNKIRIKASDQEKHKIFFGNLSASIDVHSYIREYLAITNLSNLMHLKKKIFH